jgi:hypothetical protein
MQKFTKRAVVYLPVIVVGIVVSIIVLNNVNPDIPNWLTMTVEVGIGFVIAAWVFIMQEKTSDSLLAYNDEQKKLLRSLGLHSLERIEYYLSMAQDVMGFDKDKITNSEETQRLDFVENLLSGRYDQFSARAPHVVDQLQKESSFVRPLVARIELETNLRSLIEKIQLLYGLSKDFPQGNKVQNWFAFYDWASNLIERTKELIREVRSSENDKACSS